MRRTYAAYRLVRWLSVTLPPDDALALAERCADWQWRVSATDRHAVEANLAWLCRASTVNTGLAREVFRHFGRYLVEFFRMDQPGEMTLAIDGEAYLRQAMRRSRGAIVLTAHLGNWELGAAVLRRMGWSIAAVALPHEDPRMDRLFNAQRARCGIRVIPLGPGALSEGLHHLRRGGMLGVLGDRAFVGSGLSVQCCGRPVILPRGPATLSLRARAPILPTFLIREGRWRFRLCIEPPLWPAARGAPHAVVAHLAQAYATVLERYLTRYPDQWLMFQPIAADESNARRG